MTLKNHEKTDHAYWFILAKLQPIEMQRKVAVVQRWFGARKCDVLTVGLWPTSANELQPTVNALDNAVPVVDLWVLLLRWGLLWTLPVNICWGAFQTWQLSKSIICKWPLLRKLIGGHWNDGQVHWIQSARLKKSPKNYAKKCNGYFCAQFGLNLAQLVE